MLETRPPIDSELLYEKCLDDVSFVSYMLNEFERAARDRLVNIERSLEVQDLPSIADSAHGLSGVAAMLAAQDLSRIAVDLEQAADADDLMLTVDLVDQLRTETSRLLEHIQYMRTIL